MKRYLLINKCIDPYVTPFDIEILYFKDINSLKKHLNKYYYYDKYLVNIYDITGLKDIKKRIFPK